MMSIESGPETLLNQCFKFVARHLDIICCVDPNTNNFELRQGIALPREICEKLLQVYQQNGGILDDRFVRIFSSPETSLRRVRLRNSNITDEGLTILLKHRLLELDIAKCINVSQNSLHEINRYGDRMTSLVIGYGVQLLPNSIANDLSTTEDCISSDLSSSSLQKYFILKTPKLRRLAIRCLSVNKEKMYFPILLRSLPNLTHLDLSGCNDLDDLTYLSQMPNLVSLVLHNVIRIQDALVAICELHNLRHLDISQSSEKLRIFRHENKTLARIVENLPNLESLDISGTNLAGTGVAENHVGYKCMGQTDIPGLSSRVMKPFEFLGLYGTQHGACRRHDIPAKLISGDANEAQILTAAAAYIDRPDMLQRVLNDLYHLFRYESCRNISKALSVVLDAMDRHLTEKHIQISGSATLFYIVKNTDKPALGGHTKRTIITTLLNGMNAHREDDTMMRNGCLTLCQFKIPQDVLFEYKRLVLMLLHIVSEMEQEGFVQRIGIYLLNSLACQVDGSQKQLLGDLGAIDRMLSLIEDRLERKVCDDVLEVAWSTMWNVTDETAINCERFLNGRGMDFFLGCLDLFPYKEELMRNMMGLLGNVAEVKQLRHRLMTSLYITVFTDLVDSRSDGIEVGYNAAGVLSHLASDGEEAWTISEPKREHVLQCMVNAIEHWHLDTERNINYRSFEPILQLAKVKHTPQCQHWALWALANLTRVYPDKYCLLVEAEGGLQVLEDIIHDKSSYVRLKELSLSVLSHCRTFRERGHLELQLDG